MFPIHIGASQITRNIRAGKQTQSFVCLQGTFKLWPQLPFSQSQQILFAWHPELHGRCTHQLTAVPIQRWLLQHTPELFPFVANECSFFLLFVEPSLAISLPQLFTRYPPSTHYKEPCAIKNTAFCLFKSALPEEMLLPIKRHQPYLAISASHPSIS